MIWWEKTVEYQFVLEMADCGRQFLAPLDGKYERAGDTIARMDEGNSWLLIEFKRAKESIEDEKDKYKEDLEILWGKLQKKWYSHHCHRIIYGVEEKVAGGVGSSLGLRSRAYWAQWGYSDPETKEPKNGCLNGFLNGGVGLTEFTEYVTWLIKQKKTYGKSGGGNLHAENYALVAAVSKTENGVVTCLSLAEFRGVLNLAPSPEHEPSLNIRP